MDAALPCRARGRRAQHLRHALLIPPVVHGAEAERVDVQVADLGRNVGLLVAHRERRDVPGAHGRRDTARHGLVESHLRDAQVVLVGRQERDALDLDALRIGRAHGLHRRLRVDLGIEVVFPIGAHRPAGHQIGRLVVRLGLAACEALARENVARNIRENDLLVAIAPDVHDLARRLHVVGARGVVDANDGRHELLQRQENGHAQHAKPAEDAARPGDPGVARRAPLEVQTRLGVPIERLGEVGLLVGHLAAFVT